MRSVRADRAERYLAAVGLRHAIGSGGDKATRGESLHVPFPWPRMRLFEGVGVDDEAALRRRVYPKIGEMTVAAELRQYPGRWRAREIVRHHERSAAQEREWRSVHPPITDGQQLGQS